MDWGFGVTITIITMKTEIEKLLQKEQSKTENAINVVENNNSAIDAAVADAIENLRDLPVEVSSDTILPDLSKYGFTDSRVMGPIMRRLAKAGAIQLTGRYRKSRRLGSHRMPKAIYHNRVLG